MAVLLWAQSSGFMKMGTFGVFMIIIACSQEKQGHSRHYIIVIIIMKSTQGDICRELVTCMLWFSYNSAFFAIKLTASLGGYKSRNAFLFVYHKWSNKRPGCLLNFRSQGGRLIDMRRLLGRGVYFNLTEKNLSGSCRSLS